jgi:hypothetical protein
MNNILDKLRAHAEESRRSREDAAERAARRTSALAAAAAPLVHAFREVQHEPLQVPVLRLVWGKAFDRKDERLVGLLIEVIGPGDAPYGLKLRVPSGTLRFEVELGPSDEPEYLCVRETEGLRPTVSSFADQGHWLEYFYKVLADMVEVR